MTMVCRGGVLLSLLVVLLTRSQVSGGQGCEWDSTSEHGLNPRSLDAGARHLAFLPNIKDAVGCQRACCEHPECQIAMIGTPADDGTPECFLVGCMSEGKNVCELQSDTQFNAYIKKANVQPEKIHISLLVEDKSNNTDRCRQPMHVGLCRAAFPKFYYDVTNQSCKSFTYGGCGANDNNFATLEECKTACSGVKGAVLKSNSSPVGRGARRMVLDESEPATTPSAVPHEDPVSSSPKAPLPKMTSSDFAERCEAEPVVGPCRAAMKHWYYNTETRTCRTFIYGGCRGNKNNYVDEQSCMATCTVTVIPSSRRVPVEAQSPDDQVDKDYQEYCTAAADTGPCRAAFSMFYYQPSTGTCQSFIFGGCQGNKNRYGTLEQCMTRCSGKEGQFEERGRTKRRWTPAPFFLVATLAVISALLLATLVLITLRRTRLHRQSAASISDKEELLTDPDEQSSVASLSLQGSPKVGKA